MIGQWIGVSVMLGIVSLLGFHAMEPKLQCYECENCTDTYQGTEVECDPRFYFCIFLVSPGGSIDRHCGSFGYCSDVMQPDGNCSMCSAHLCNSEFNRNGQPPGGTRTPAAGVAALTLVAASLACASVA